MAYAVTVHNGALTMLWATLDLLVYLFVVNVVCYSESAKSLNIDMILASTSLQDCESLRLRSNLYH